MVEKPPASMLVATATATAKWHACYLIIIFRLKKFHGSLAETPYSFRPFPLLFRPISLKWSFFQRLSCCSGDSLCRIILRKLFASVNWKNGFLSFFCTLREQSKRERYVKSIQDVINIHTCIHTYVQDALAFFVETFTLASNEIRLKRPL